MACFSMWSFFFFEIQQNSTADPYKLGGNDWWFKCNHRPDITFVPFIKPKSCSWVKTDQNDRAGHPIFYKKCWTACFFNQWDNRKLVQGNMAKHFSCITNPSPIMGNHNKTVFIPRKTYGFIFIRSRRKQVNVLNTKQGRSFTVPGARWNNATPTVSQGVSHYASFPLCYCEATANSAAENVCRILTVLKPTLTQMTFMDSNASIFTRVGEYKHATLFSLEIIWNQFGRMNAH